MNLIVNVTPGWGIGCGNQLLVAIPSDLRRFRELTTGKVVILGRKTLATFPGGRPLKNRVNVVLSTNPDFTCEGAVVVRSRQPRRFGDSELRFLESVGNLLGSLTREVEGNTLRVGTNRIYGAIHQFGGQAGRGRKVSIPARPWLGLSRDDITMIREEFEEFAARAVRRG